ncbi:MAG: ATP-binding protein [Planctomycetota bacterium]
MLRSRLFWKLLLAFSALHAVGLGLLGYAAIDRHRRVTVEQAEAELHKSVESAKLLLSARAELGDREADQALIENAAAIAECRFTLIGPEGQVLADSSAEEALGATAQNLAQRPEVIAALAGVQGIDRRGGRLPGGDMLYVAHPVAFDSELAGAGIAVIRASLSLMSPRSPITGWWLFYMLSGLAVATLFAVVATSLIRHVVRPVLSLGEAADAITRGDYKQRAFVANNDELGLLAQSLNQMSEELGSQLVELREGGQRQATVLGGMIEGVIAVDERERVLFANTAAGKLFGFIPPQVEGRPLLEVVRHHTLHDTVATGLSSGWPQRLEIEWEGLSLSVQATPLPGDPCPGLVIVLHDTTELRRLESLRQDFVANVSHELKTPLSSIKAYTETLIDGALNDPEHNVQFLRRIEEQADRLNYLIQDLLALARIESAQQPFEIGQVAIADVATACLNDYQPQAEAKRICLAGSEPREPKLQVTADPEGLRVILNNLIDNAIKYTPGGGEVSVHWEPTADDRVRVDVTDTGIGIPADALPRVFERFFRVDKARSREVGGTGLGLAIVKHLAQAFGGSVSVQSEEGVGTTFTVSLPMAQGVATLA